jgi:hypothetical protein
MSIQLSWYLENRVMLLVNHDQNTDQDMLAIDQPMINYLNQSNAPLVHVIMDNIGSTYTPSIKVLKTLQYPKHPRLGWLILIGLINPFQRFIAAVVTTFFKTRLRMVNTMDEALDFLNEVDSTLPELHNNKLDKAS